MTEGEILSILKDAMVVVLKLASPMLIVSIVVGLIIAIFQAATQIHEQTLTFVPKLIAIAAVLLLSGSWMISVLSEFTYSLYVILSQI